MHEFEIFCSLVLVSSWHACSKQLQMRPCSKAAWASIFVPFHLLGKSWTWDYFFRCQQYPVIIPLLTYNCLVAESLPSQQWWAQRWRHLFTETEVWEQINSRFGKGRGGRGRLSLNTSISSLRQARQYRKMPHTALQRYLKWTSQNHTEAVFEFTNKKITNSSKAAGLHLIIVCCWSGSHLHFVAWSK